MTRKIRTLLMRHPHRTIDASPAIGMDRGAEGITLCTLDADGVERIGTFTSAAQAWAALDLLDPPASAR